MLLQHLSLRHERGDRRPELVGDVGREPPAPGLRLGERRDPARGDPGEGERHHDEGEPTDQQRGRELRQVVADRRLGERRSRARVAAWRRPADEQGRHAVDLDAFEPDLAVGRQLPQPFGDGDANAGSDRNVSPSANRTAWIPRSS